MIDIIVVGLIILFVALIIWRSIKRRRAGLGGCAGCSQANSCPKSCPSLQAQSEDVTSDSSVE